MRTLPVEVASELIQFAGPGKGNGDTSFATFQLEGAVAAYNHIARNRFAYLADEVGMGKTYVALGVMALLRHFEPDARIMVIAPRQNLQQKWIKELRNFVGRNWLAPDNRVQSIQETPTREPCQIGSLRDLVAELIANADRDFFLRMTSFSLRTKHGEDRRKGRKELRKRLPWVPARELPVRDPHDYRVAYGRVLNRMLPEIDLLIVDEGHNLKHGLDPRGSTRNVLLASAFGHPDLCEDAPETYGPKVRRLLFLSATPFEHDYADLYRQLDLFGFGAAAVKDAAGAHPLRLDTLNDPDSTEEAKREIVGRFLLRRVSGLSIGGRFHTKNMYRREWRGGGFSRHDDPMRLTDPKQRLVVGLVQKKVAELLGDDRFNNHFQIGMLSSFESFLESVTRKAQPEDDPSRAEEENDAGRSTFDGRQTDDHTERQGIDTDSLSRIVHSYRERFGEALPHPKVDATVQDLVGSFESGEKVLVFVRRLATMRELKARLDDHYNAWLKQRMLRELPTLQDEVEQLFERFFRERNRAQSLAAGDEDATVVEGADAVGRDEGGRDTFFAWFFRGDGPPDVLSGAAFQKNRLASRSSAYATLLEDDLVSWLLGRPEHPLAALADRLNVTETTLRDELRGRAYGAFRRMTGQQEGYPRLYVFEAYQLAALDMLRDQHESLAEEARIILHERFEGAAPRKETPPAGFPGPEVSIGAVTVITELAKYPAVEGALLPMRRGVSFRERFLDRECRRELFSAMCRLGAAYVDLYLLAIRGLGSFQLRQLAEGGEHQLARDFAGLLDAQSRTAGFHAYRELAAAAEAFDTLVNVNFPEVRQMRLAELASLFARWLQRQRPVAVPRPGRLSRLVRQFRMPGYPLVLVTTDILQEGEDLHTFCRKVVHYGISWTPSSMEQRTGRVDRIGSYVQRRLDGRTDPVESSEHIQVHYPHLRDTVEVLQVERVFQRMNRFLRLMHKNVARKDKESRIDIRREMLAIRDDIEVIREPLESAFPVREECLRGERTLEEGKQIDVAGLDQHLQRVWSHLVNRLGIEETPTGRPFVLGGLLFLEGGQAHPFEVELRSEAFGDATLLRCRSSVGPLDLSSKDVVDTIQNLQRELGIVKVCARPDSKRKRHFLTLEGGIPFNSETTQPIEVEMLLLRTTRAAQHIQSQLMEQAPETIAPRVREKEMKQLRTLARNLVARQDLPIRLALDEDSIAAEFPNGRSQRVHLDCRGSRYSFTSVVLDATHVEDGGHGWYDLNRAIWEKNALTDLVTFAIDEEERLVGRIEHPVTTLDPEEFEAYVMILLRECDRFEYGLTGEDWS